VEEVEEGGGGDVCGGVGGFVLAAFEAPLGGGVCQFCGLYW